MTRDELEEAAFWGKWVCADCDTLVEDGEVAFACPGCGGETVLPAAGVLKVVERMEGEGV